MSTIYQEKLSEIVEEIGISPEDVQTCLYEFPLLNISPLNVMASIRN